MIEYPRSDVWQYEDDSKRFSYLNQPPKLIYNESKSSTTGLPYSNFVQFLIEAIQRQHVVLELLHSQLHKKKGNMVVYIAEKKYYLMSNDLVWLLEPPVKYK